MLFRSDLLVEGRAGFGQGGDKVEKCLSVADGYDGDGALYGVDGADTGNGEKCDRNPISNPWLYILNVVQIGRAHV